MIKLQLCLINFLIIFVLTVKCNSDTNDGNEDQGILSIVEEFSSHRFRRNLSGSVHSRFDHHHFNLVRREDEDEPLLGRRLLNAIRQPTTLINTFSTPPQPPPPPPMLTFPNHQDPLWNSNNRFNNRFDRYDKYDKYSDCNNNNNTYSSNNRRPFPISSYEHFPTTTMPPQHSRPKYQLKPVYKPANNHSNKPTAVSSSIRPVNVRPTFATNNNNRPMTKYPKYTADCACKRKMGGSGGGFSQPPSLSRSSTTETLAPSPSTVATTNKPNAHRFPRTRSSSSHHEDSYRKKDIENRIVNGTVADYFRFPWTVSLGRAIDDKYTNDSHYCGGTLISPSWVLSAGHCLTDFKPKKIIVAYGAGDRSKMKHFAEVDRVIVHPQYSGWPKYLNDVALVRLKEPVHLDGSIKPACLHSHYVNFKPEYEAVGWGRTGAEEEFSPLLQKVKFDFVTPSECRTRWDKELDHPDITLNNICVYKKNSDICGGDSGSPLMNSGEDNVFYMVGVASFTNFCDQTQPAVYVRVYPYIDWIVNVVKTFC